MCDTNGGRNEAIGTLWNVEIFVEKVRVVCAVNVMDGVEFDLLLGRTFLDAANAQESYSKDGAGTIALRDEHTGRTIVLPTRIYDPRRVNGDKQGRQFKRTQNMAREEDGPYEGTSRRRIFNGIQRRDPHAQLWVA